MAQCKEKRRRNMLIFQYFPTLRWAILAKSPSLLGKWGDAQMASISGRKPLAKAGQPSLRAFRCDMFAIGRLEGDANESVT